MPWQYATDPRSKNANRCMAAYTDSRNPADLLVKHEYYTSSQSTHEA
jgi:hypothetical protein